MKETPKPRAEQDRLHFGLATGSHHRKLIVVQLWKQLHNLGRERLKLQHPRKEQVLLAGVFSDQPLDVEGWIGSVAKKREQSAIGDADPMVSVCRPIEMQAMGSEDLLPAGEMNGLAVSEHAIEIK